MPANLAAAADMLGRPEAYRETNETIALGMQWGTHARRPPAEVSESPTLCKPHSLIAPLHTRGE